MMQIARTTILLVAIGLAAQPASAASCSVPAGAGCGTIQAALAQAVAGDTISVAPGVYSEKISFVASGNAGAGFITLQGAPGHASVLDGTGVTGAHMVSIASRSYIKLIGFEIRNNLNVRDGSGVRVEGSGSHIEIRDNRIHGMRGANAMGITVYGTQSASISQLIIAGNEIYDSEPAPSEALTLNGNVEQFEVSDNYVHDVNNIGIDFIGGETDIQPNNTKVARDGVCRGNRVERARSSYGGGFAGAIYVDGGKDIVIERNLTTESDLGIEVGAENAGIVTSGIVVRDNIFYRNDKAGLVFGGFASNVGRVANCTFTNNTLYDNDTLATGFGELWIQFAENNTLRNNLFASTAEVVLRSEDGNVANLLDYNLWWTSPGATFVWRNQSYGGFAAFQAGSGQEVHSLAADPQFVDAPSGDFHLRSTSPARDAGDPTFVPASGESDIDAAPRVSGGRVDIGADEITCGDGVVDPGESCDDSNTVDCDGCDSNCTESSACGNGIVCGGEQCDDGGAVDGDCCDAHCELEAAGAGCDDDDLCTNDDACDGAGACAGSATPLPAAQCRQPVRAQRSKLQIKDGNPDALDRLSWGWSKGELTTTADFGDPGSNTRYALCIYDQSASSQPVWQAEIAAGGICGSRPCWKSARSGFRFSAGTATSASSGVARLSLGAGGEGKARLSLRGKGAFLPAANLPWTTPVVVQLRNRLGGCWGATFSNPKQNEASGLQATSD